MEDKAESLPRGTLSAFVRQGYREEARRNRDDNNLWLVAWSKCNSLSTRFYHKENHSVSAEVWEWDMHDIWALYYEASINTSEDSPAMYRLAFQIVQEREQGLLTRLDGDKSTQAAMSDGNIWTNLPFLVPDMTKYWVEGSGLSSAQRLSFSKFLANLASAGVGKDDGLCGIALVTFRQALETPRPLGTFADQEQEEDTSRAETDLSIAAYLPSVNSWLSWAGLKMIQMSEEGKSWQSSGEDGRVTGPLFPNTDTVQGTPIVGFSIPRWIFWAARLESLSKSFQDAGEDELATMSIRVMENMLILVEATGGRLRKDLEAAYVSGTLQHRTVNRPPG